MARRSNVLSISLPPTLTKEMDRFQKKTAQTRSELVRNAVRAYLRNEAFYTERFLEAFEATRNEKKISLTELKKKRADA